MAPVITQKPGNEIPAEILAQSIVAISEGIKQINQTRLTRKALIVLIHDYSRVPKKQIEIVLNNLDLLDKIWLKPKDQTK